MRNLLKISFLFLLIVFSSSKISAQNTNETINDQTTQMVKPITNKETLYVDVRTPAEFAEGSVKGAVNIPLDQIEKQLLKFKDKKKIIVFCRSGNRSSQAMAILNQNGINNVTNGGSLEDVKAKMKK